MTSIYKTIQDFKSKYPGGVSWRIKKHAQIIDKHLNPGEEVIFAFPAQKNNEFYNIFTTCIVALTNKRILIGQKRVVWGSFYNQITPDLYNDMQVYQGLHWGHITIDTIKEVVVLSNLPKRSLDEIETQITEYMMEEKKKYPLRNDEI